MYEIFNAKLMRKCLLTMLMLVIQMLTLMLLNLNTCYGDADANKYIRIMSLYCKKETEFEDFGIEL